MARLPARKKTDPIVTKGHVPVNEVLERLRSKGVPFFTPTTYQRSGILPLDAVFENQGIPVGKYVELASKEGLGKTTTMLHLSRLVCEAGGSIFYMDSENAITSSIMEGTGVNEYLDNGFYPVGVQTFREASDVMDEIIPTHPTFIIFDSITSLKPASLLDQNVEDVQPGLVSRLQSNFLMKYKDVIARNGITVILLNQMRNSFDFKSAAGSAEIPAGGNALRFYSDVRLVMRRIADVETEDKEKIGVRLRMRPLKNKICKSREVEFQVMFGRGVSNLDYMNTLLIDMGVCTQRGSFFVFRTSDIDKTVRGREEAAAFIQENFDYFEGLIDQMQSGEEISPTDAVTSDTKFVKEALSDSEPKAVVRATSSGGLVL